jgi:hypothetical protein
LGDAPWAWREHSCRELGRLTGSSFALIGELAWRPGKPLRPLAQLTWGWENGLNKAAFEQAIANHRDDLSPSLLFTGYLGAAPREPGHCATRTDCVTDSDWYPSTYFDVIHGAMGIDHSLICMREFSRRPGVHSAYVISRGLGETTSVGATGCWSRS